MKTSAKLVFLPLFLIACGDGPGGSKEIGKSLNDLSSPPAYDGTVTSSTFTPGSYFKVVKEVGSSKDTRVYEFQFLSDKRFIITQTSFLGGDLTKAYLHKKTGSFTEYYGVVDYSPTYDTCGNLTSQRTLMSGDRNSVISVTYNDSRSTFYSYNRWTLPSDISSHIVDAVEDIGCVFFKD